MLISDIFGWMTSRRNTRKSSSTRPKRGSKADSAEQAPSNIANFFNRTPVIMTQQASISTDSPPQNLSIVGSETNTSQAGPILEEVISTSLDPSQQMPPANIPLDVHTNFAGTPAFPPQPPSTSMVMGAQSNRASTPALPPAQSRFPGGLGAVSKINPALNGDRSLSDHGRVTPIRSVHQPIMETSQELLEDSHNMDLHENNHSIDNVSNQLAPVPTDQSRNTLLEHHQQVLEEIQQEFGLPTFASSEQMASEMRQVCESEREKSRSVSGANAHDENLENQYELEDRMMTVFASVYHKKESEGKSKQAGTLKKAYKSIHRSELRIVDMQRDQKTAEAKLNSAITNIDTISDKLDGALVQQKRENKQLRKFIAEHGLDIAGLKIGQVTNSTNIKTLHTEACAINDKVAVNYTATKESIREAIVNEIRIESLTVCISGIKLRDNRQITRGDKVAIGKFVCQLVPALVDYLNVCQSYHTDQDKPGEQQPDTVTLYVTFADTNTPLEMTRAFYLARGRSTGLSCWLSKPRKVRAEIKKWLAVLTARNTPGIFYRVEIGKLHTNERGFLLASYASSTPDGTTGRLRWLHMYDANQARLRIDLTETESYRIFTRFEADREHFGPTSGLKTCENLRLFANPNFNNELRITAEPAGEGTQGYDDWLNTCNALLQEQRRELAQHSQLSPIPNPLSPSASEDSYESEDYPLEPPPAGANPVHNAQIIGEASALPVLRQRLINGQATNTNSFMDVTNDDRHLYSLSNQQANVRPSQYVNQPLPRSQQHQAFTFNQNPLNASYQYRSAFAQQQQASFATSGVRSTFGNLSN